MVEQAKHISSSFDSALYGLRNDVLIMSSLTDRILQTAFEALLNRDSELCDHVIAEDEEVDILEKQVDQDGVSLLIRFQPVASDMRQVVSAMKVSANLERIADKSVTIARRAKHLNGRPPLGELALLEQPYRLAVTLFRDSMRAFADGDYELARTLKLKDRELDALTNDLSEKFVQQASSGSELVPSYVDLIFVARALERNRGSCYEYRRRCFLARPGSGHPSYLRAEETVLTRKNHASYESVRLLRVRRSLNRCLA